MADLIDRQAAIDEFEGVKVDEEYCTEYDIGYNDGIDFAISKLSVLPSAQTNLQPTCNQLATDCISRQAAIDAINCDITITGKKNAETVAETIGLFVDRLKALPTAERKGHWVKKWHTVFKEDLPCCSECNNFMAFTFDYCPNCGARMESDE